MPTTTFEEIRREMFSGFPTDIGRAVDVTSLTTTTLVSSQLIRGSESANKYDRRYMLRPDTATAADRVRMVKEGGFASSTGTLTHEGTNYGDTTATGEVAEILAYDPWRMEMAIVQAMERTRYLDTTELPSGRSGLLWLNALDWVEKPEDIWRITRDGSGILSRNRYIDKWTSYSSGTLLADFWTLSGSGATAASSTTQAWKNGRSLALTRSGADVTYEQDVGLLKTGASTETGLAGEIVTVAGWAWSDTASRVRLFVNDGVTTTTSDYHTGGSGWEELTKEVTVSSSATQLTFGIQVNTGNVTAYIGECYLVAGNLGDAQRRDGPWDDEIVWSSYEQGHEAMPVTLPSIGLGQRYLIHSQRKYPVFDITRVRAGTADADTTYAPKRLIAVGALHHLFDGLAQAADVDTTKMESLSRYWGRKWETMQAGHLYVPNQGPVDRLRNRLMGRTWGSAGRGVT